MMLEIGAILLYLLLITPVRIRIDAWWRGELQIDCWMRVWNLPLGTSVRFGGTEGRNQPYFAMEDGMRLNTAAVRRGMAAVGAVLRGNWARRRLMRHLQVLQADACIRISLHSAAKTALAAGIAQWLAQAAHSLSGGKARIVTLPAFADERSCAEARCILFFHLGHMIPVLLAMLAAWLMERREHRVTDISKEA